MQSLTTRSFTRPTDTCAITGENIFFLPDTYSVAADGLAYDGAGNVFAAGWDMPYYDPADDWGENWASNWN